MDIQTYSNKALLFNKPLNYRDQILHAALGVTSDGGEFADAVKASMIYGKPEDVINMVEELGDVLWFINLAIRTLGYTLEDVMLANIAKLEVRYSEGYSDAKALNRHKELEREAIQAVLTRE